MVAYKEAPVMAARSQVEFERKISGEIHHVDLDISVKPLDIRTEKPRMRMSRNQADKNNIDQLR